MASHVTLTVDGRPVQVPAGTGLVEAAAALDVEIPVFCYEPRIGPAVGVCRMCLVEIEGVPKLQTACSTPVREGMVVSTVSGRARDAQEAILEFLLINHPLDCPVCDKGGECPLQDHAFRWGPGASRFGELKRNSDKPIPISPLIALDRERCVLCYRCTRFSEEVSEDLQLVTRDRGSSSVIATFEGRPYEGHFSGNVIELCPVGALTNTEYRFRGRPWETTDHPSVCTGCSVGCNTWNSVREGDVVRVLARENVDVDEGWLCDRGRFAYPAHSSPARLRRPQERANRERPMGNRPVAEPSHELAMEWLYERIMARSEWRPHPDLPENEEQSPPPPELWVLSGTEPLEAAWAVRELAGRTGGRVVAAPGGSAALPEHPATLADLERAGRILVLGDDDLLDTAPILDLRIRKALRRGARVSVASVGGTRLELAGGPGARVDHVRVEPGRLEAWVEQLVDASGAVPEGATVVVMRDGQLAPRLVARLGDKLGFPRAGSGVLSVPDAANARGLAAIGIAPAPWSEILAHRGGVVYVGVDPARHVAEDAWILAIRAAAWCVAVDALPTALHAVADLVLPAATNDELDGTVVNLEGRIQRLTQAVAPPDGVRPLLGWVSGLARRAGAKVPGTAASAYRVLTAAVGDNLPVAHHREITAGGRLGVHGGTHPVPAAEVHAVESPAPASDDDVGEPGGGTRLDVYVAPFLYDSVEVAHTERMAFLYGEARLVMSRSDARARGLTRGARVHVSLAGQPADEPVLATVQTTATMLPGHARIHAGAGAMAPGRTGWTTAVLEPTGAGLVPATTGGNQPPCLE